MVVGSSTEKIWSNSQMSGSSYKVVGFHTLMSGSPTEMVESIIAVGSSLWISPSFTVVVTSSSVIGLLLFYVRGVYYFRWVLYCGGWRSSTLVGSSEVAARSSMVVIWSSTVV